MKLTNPAGRVERIGFLKRGPGFTVAPTAVFRHRRELGLDRNTLLVLLSVLSHGRPEATDYCEVAYAVITRDTGLHKTVVCNAIKAMLAPLGSQVVLVKRKKTKDARTTSISVTVRGLGLLARAPRKQHRTKTGRCTSYVWRNGGPKYDTNVYFLGPLADRLVNILNPRPVEPSAETMPSDSGAAREFDVEAEPGPEEEQDRPLNDWATEQLEQEEYGGGPDDDESEWNRRYEQQP